MTDHLTLTQHDVTREDRSDGAIVLRSNIALRQPAQTASDWVRAGASAHPDRPAFAERCGQGWRMLSYAELWDAIQAVAGGLLARGLKPQGAGIMILSGNAIDHAVLSLAAHHVGIVTIPVAEQYSLIPAAHERLAFVAQLTTPAMVYASDAQAYGPAIDLLGLPAICSEPGDSGHIPFADLLNASPSGVSDMHARTGPDTIAKVLTTSGSTSDPKGVETTQRMMTTNQAQIAASLPFLKEKPPVLVDWLPWNHVFGGSHNFNLALANGGTFYIDDGKPMPALFPRTLENLGLVSSTLSFNVPVGYAQLVNALEKDSGLRQTYFQSLDMIFYAGASLPQDTWSALERLAMDTLGRLPLITSSWGLTETAPAAMLQTVPAKGAGIVGVPMPGVTVKLIDDGDGRMDVRVKGDSIFDAYLKNPAKTAEAFDEEGFFITGDAMRFVDPGNMNAGLQFDGRLSEDFKLTTGTWVRAANLRLEVLAALAPLAMDVVITGAARDEIGLLIVPNRPALDAAGLAFEDDGAVLSSDILGAAVSNKLADLSASTRGSAMRISRALVMSELPSMAEGEATAKGNLNFPKLLQRRAALVDRLYDDADPACIQCRA